jgi:DNA-binding GntR family transcriptional regulator
VSADLLEGDDVPPRIIDALDLEPGARVVIRRERVTHSPERAQSTSVSWFDGALADAAPLLLTTERIKGGTAEYITQMTGRGPSTRGKVIRQASRATEAEAAHLGISPGDPVMRGSNWYLTEDGTVIEYGESVAIEDLPETFEYTLNSTKKG